MADSRRSTVFRAFGNLAIVSLRALPSVDTLAGQLDDRLPRGLRTLIARAAIDEAREHLSAGHDTDASRLAADRASGLISRRLTRVINASGVLLHTNLGRATLHPEAAEAASAVATSFGNVEFDLPTRQRGGRGSYLADLLRALTGAESAHVVNNNAAGLLLALAALADGKPVPVSRGELIEIGGSYRLPELMSVSGARLLEIGTTNKTRLADYESAFEHGPAAVLKVHPSNYRVVGFAEEVAMSDLVSATSANATPLIYDIGSGLLDTEVPWLNGPPPPWLAGEPGALQEVKRGADLVLFSGDKLLGGPQAGVVVGKSTLVERMRSHPLARALRIDGPTMAALTVTLELYLAGRGAEIPFWRHAATSVAELNARLEGLDAAGMELVMGASLLGAGSVPGLEIPGPVGRIRDEGRCWEQLLDHDPPILTRRDAGDLVVDLRAVAPRDDSLIRAALSKVLQ